MESKMELSHLRREVSTALELAIVGLAPSELISGLAEASGMLDALSELPIDSAPVVALVPKTAARAQGKLEEWRGWRKKHLGKATA